MKRFALLLLLAGCTAPHTTVISPPSEARYLRWPRSFTTDTGVFPVTFHLYPHNNGGKLALCGYYVADGHNMTDLLMETSFNDDRSGIYFEKKRVTSLAFLPGYKSTVPADTRAPHCVKTETDWSPSFANPTASFGWPPVRVTR